MKKAIYIHTNSQQLLGAKVAAYSFKKNCAIDVEVKFIHLDDHPTLTSKEGRSYRRKGRSAVWRNNDLQSFSPLRFLPPQLQDYTGFAVVTDPDVFAVGDITPLFDKLPLGKSIACRQVHDGPYTANGAFWATSVMLLNCEKLKHWYWDKTIDDLFANRFDYGDWIQLKLEDPQTIADLEERWNSFDKLNQDTRLLHTTERRTQPWKTGLPIDFDLTDNSWLTRFWRMPLRSLQNLGDRKHASYLPHPDINQRRFFFGLLKECLDSRFISESEVKENIDQKYIRPDVFEALTRYTREDFEVRNEIG